MEKEKNNDDPFLVSFFELLMHPWKEQPTIQDSIPDHPVNNEEEAQYLKLEKYCFYHYRITAPFFGALGYLSLAKVHFLKYVLEHDIITDFIKNRPRLTSHEIFMAFDGVSNDNALFLLDQINCPVSVYTELRESLLAEDEMRFVNAIDGCDISNITPVLKYIKTIKDKALRMVEGRNNKFDENHVEGEDFKKKVLYEQEAFVTGKLGWQPNGEMTRLWMLVMKKMLEWDIIPDAVFDFVYSYHYWLYCYLKEDGAFNESDTIAFEYMFRQPAFEKQYEENQKWWQDQVIVDKLTEYYDLLGITFDFDDDDNNPNNDQPDATVDPKTETQSKSKDDRWRLQGYLKRPQEPGDDHCIGFKESICQSKSDVDIFLTKLIQGLAKLKYIDDDPITKNSFAYVLTGRGGFQTKIKKVEWKHPEEENGCVPESIKVLLYLSSHLFDARKTEGKTYTQMFKHLNAGRNPYIKEDGRDQSPSYVDSVSDKFKEFYKRCLKKQVKRASL